MFIHLLKKVYFKNFLAVVSVYNGISLRKIMNKLRGKYLPIVYSKICKICSKI